MYDNWETKIFKSPIFFQYGLVARKRLNWGALFGEKYQTFATQFVYGVRGTSFLLEASRPGQIPQKWQMEDAGEF